MSGKTILYVEDNELNRKIVRDLLRRTSYQLIEAPDGETGVQMALEQRPDLILMDVQLPEDLRHRGDAPAPGRAGHRGHPDHRHHVLCAERGRAAGEGGRGVHVPGEAVQSVLAPRHDSKAAPRRVSEAQEARGIVAGLVRPAKWWEYSEWPTLKRVPERAIMEALVH